MNTKPLYEQIFNLLDFADTIVGMLETEASERSNYFMTLIYVEDILDKYGRGLILHSALDSGKSQEESRALMAEANQRMDKLRRQIRNYSQQFDFDELLKTKGERMYQDWHKLPHDHPNLNF